MPSHITPRPRRLTFIRGLAAWLCAFSLVVVLANRFPRHSAYYETSWIPSSSSHTTAKVMAKEFFVLEPPAAGRILLSHSAPVRVEISEERPFVAVVLEKRLFTRPPPSV
jgi:hypothetical protein